MNFKEFSEETLKLSKLVTQKPDVIVGIMRGGLVPARLLSTYLDVKDMQCVAVRKIEGKRIVTTDILDDLEGKKILLVEDVLESGRSLKAAEQYLKKKGADVQTACLYTMLITEITPTYSLKRIDELVSFPWE